MQWITDMYCISADKHRRTLQYPWRKVLDDGARRRQQAAGAASQRQLVGVVAFGGRLVARKKKNETRATSARR